MKFAFEKDKLDVSTLRINQIIKAKDLYRVLDINNKTNSIIVERVNSYNVKQKRKGLKQRYRP